MKSSHFLSLMIAICLSGAFSSTSWAAEETVADSLRKYRFLAKTARETKDWDSALGYYGKQLKFETEAKRRRIAHFQVAKIQILEKKQPRLAIRSLRSALTIDSMYVNANDLLSKIYLQSGKADSAAECLQRVVTARPKKPQFRRDLADLCRRQNRTVDAIRHYEALVELIGEDEELVDILALLEEDAGHLAEALAWRQRLLALQVSPDQGKVEGSRPATRETLEQILALQRQINDAEGAFETLAELIESDPANSYSYYNQVVELAESVEDEEARLKGLEGMALADAKSVAVATLVELHLHEHRHAPARRWLSHGMGANPTSARLQLFNGDLLVAEGKEEEALKAYERAKLDPIWESIAQQRIWNLQPPERPVDVAKRAFFGEGANDDKPPTAASGQ